MTQTPELDGRKVERVGQGVGSLDKEDDDAEPGTKKRSCGRCSRPRAGERTETPFTVERAAALRGLESR